MIVTEPLSRRLMHFGRVYMHALAKQVHHLDINRYHDILAIIYLHNGQLTQKALGQMLDKDKSSLVSIIDLLTEKGYVYREINPADRREQLLKITAKAEQEVPEIIKAFDHLNKTSTQSITATDISIFNKVLATMEANLKQQTI
ncbi:MarR family winged helix-turn-helix transcriptional regulator [Mucilaginibacter ginkgonis]|uniref:MarR family transcriptional regulator n=1 Tax=Mucilaginibacter ginkgonis TaxID=2682091 RepID=A0A6I4HY76_9SPHI|nr:MarR family transcriptional regulator [Mucilaginibacter ginkgonis]QQL49535.1 MarR family transcriptional regulator [Mucilaginibacter ginkgonis]